MASHDAPPGRGERTEPVGGPLDPADAAFLRHELSERGIPVTLWPEPGPPVVKTHLLLVTRHDSERAHEIRKALLPEEPARPGASRSFARRLGPPAAGALGVMTGARIGVRFPGHVMAVALPIALGLVAYLAASRLGGRAPRAPSR